MEENFFECFGKKKEEFGNKYKGKILFGMSDRLLGDGYDKDGNLLDYSILYAVVESHEVARRMMFFNGELNHFSCSEVI